MKNFKTVTTIAVLAAAMSVTSCKQNPFPTDGVISGERLEQRAVLPPYGIDVQDIMDFAEGVPGEFNVKSWVPGGKTPIVTLYNLPAGAEFNQAEAKLKWTPGYDAANNPNELASRIRTYSVQIVVRSEDDPLASVQRTVTLQVKDTPRKFKVEFAGMATVQYNGTQVQGYELTEGKEFVGKFNIVSEDFPQGPFQLAFTGFPLGTTITQAAPNSSEYVVKYTPNAFDAKAVDGGKVCSRNLPSWGNYPCSAFAGKVTAITPNAYQTDADANLVIIDSRISPKISAPTAIVQGADVSFAVTGVDLNGEYAPEISLRSVVPPYGKFTFTSDRKELNDWQGPPMTTLNVDWKDIPSNMFGAEETLEFKVCTLSTPQVWMTNKYGYAKNLCSFQKVTVKFQPTTHAPPVVDRNPALPNGNAFGTFIRVKVKTSSKPYAIDVNDSEDKSKLVAVSFEGINKPGDPIEVTWTKGKVLSGKKQPDEMVVTPAKEGMRQFTLVATSAYGASTREVFFLDALPATWKDGVLIARGGDSESKAFQTLVSNADFADSELDVTERTFSSRSIALISTGGLTSSRVSVIESAAQKLNNVLISSPLLSALTGSLAAEIKSLGFEVRERVPSVAGLVVTPVSGGALTQPADAITLSGVLTAESKSPATFRVASSSNCKTILELGKSGSIASDPVGLSCNRANGGKLIVIGTELADLVTSTKDAGLVKKWIEEMLKP